MRCYKRNHEKLKSFGKFHTLLRLGISICIILGITFTSAYAYEISYNTEYYRLQNPPTYCIEEPYDSSDADILVPLAEDALNNWQKSLQDAEFENPEYWKINSKIISNGGSKSDCDITIHFVGGTQKQQEGYRILGTMFYYRDAMEIYHQDIGIEKIFNILVHEIGHSFGLGHYVADDNEVNKKFYSSDKLAPSIMIPTTHNDPSLIKITQIDVDKVRSIYGSQGFYAFSDLVPPPAEPEKPTTPIPKPGPLQPVSPFKYLKISEDQIIIGKYESKTVKIAGQINEDIYMKGHPVFLLIIKPDYTTEVHRLPVTGTGYFEVPIKFDSTDPYGSYEVEGSYMEFTDERTNFEFSIISSMYEQYDTPSKKPITKSVPKADNPSKTITEKPEKKEIKKDTKKEIKEKTKKETKKEIKPAKKEAKKEIKSKDTKTVKIARGQTTHEKISGAIPMDLYKKGKPADVTILRPDGTTEMQKITISNKGKFEHLFSITDRTIPGKYEITISYSGMIAKKFTYEIKN